MEKAAVLDPPITRPSTPSSPARAGGTMVILAYAATIFFSAFLLFQVQPLISKFILPWFGGSPAVWTAAMLFFQVALFGGYLYAHLTSTYLSSRGQFFLHAALLAAATLLTLVTYISPGELLKPTGGPNESPLMLILTLLTVTVGLPYFVLSSTGPLLQKWFSDAFEGASPYRLFALSNLGSLLALLTYPFFFEVYWDSREQAMLWSFAFVFFAVCCAFCAWWTWQARQAHAAETAQARAVAAAQRDVARPSPLRIAGWILLPALASMMFLAVTNEVCQNIATVPMLWIVPLSLYLISFIIAFDHPRWYSRPVYGIAAVIVLLYMADFSHNSDRLEDVIEFIRGYRADQRWLRYNVYWEFGAYFTGLFLVCMVCHCELAALKPAPRYLTAFFLTMSAGGAVGGIFVNLIAPYIFRTFFEFPLALVVSTALAGFFATSYFRQKGLPIVAGAIGVLAVQAAILVAYWQVGANLFEDPDANKLTVHRARNFYGLVSVDHNDRDLREQGLDFYTFRSGHIVHGRQWAHPSKRSRTDIAYWGPGTGCRRAVEYKVNAYDGQRAAAPENHCRIGIVGLGIGTIAGMAKEGDYVRMYEINPEVIEIAQGEHFTFLKDCKAKQDIVLGDARLQLENELKEGSNQFDVLCLDAFSGDAVPMHLLTSEAFEIYKKHMKPNGIIVANITNTYLDLYPVITRLAEEHGFQHTRIFVPKDADNLRFRTYFTLVTNDAKFLAANPPAIDELPPEFSQARTVPLWTDRYHSLWHVLQD